VKKHPLRTRKKEEKTIHCLCQCAAEEGKKTKKKGKRQCLADPKWTIHSIIVVQVEKCTRTMLTFTKYNAKERP